MAKNGREKFKKLCFGQNVKVHTGYKEPEHFNVYTLLLSISTFFIIVLNWIHGKGYIVFSKLMRSVEPPSTTSRFCKTVNERFINIS